MAKIPKVKSRRRFLKNSLSSGLVLTTPLLPNHEQKRFTGISVTQAPKTPRLPCKIISSAALDPEYSEAILSISDEMKLMTNLSGSAYTKELEDADVYLGRMSEEDFGRAKNLKWVQSISAGVERQLFPAFVQSEILLTNAKGCYGPAIAEHAMGMLLSLTRKIGSQVRRMQEKDWGGSGEQLEIKDMTMGIVGFGGIGRQVARRAKAMDMRVVAADIQGFYPEQIGDLCDTLYHVQGDGLEELLAQSDVVVSAAPHTPISEGMFGREEFAQMKRGAFFINVSRGKLVDTPAIVEALKSSHLKGVALDVTDPEPLPAGHPLWEFENVIITSHISGRSQYSWKRLQAVFADNVYRYVNGYPLVNRVDKVAGF